MVENQVQISMEEIEGVDIEDEDIQNLQEKVEYAIEKMKEFEDEMEFHMADINDSKVYRELGIELSVDITHEFSMDEREEKEE